MTDLSHAALIVRAVRWLRGTRCCSTVFSEVANVTSEIPDAIGWKGTRSIVIECKASRADFLRDRDKSHMRDGASGMGRERWYLTPPRMVDTDEVPDWCGLLYCGARSLSVVRQAPWREVYDNREEVALLVCALRRHSLGTLLDENGRWETMYAREARQRREAPADPADVVW